MNYKVNELNESFEKIINESVFLEDFYTILRDRNGTVIFIINFQKKKIRRLKRSFKY